MAEWTNEMVIELLKMYRDRPFLWDSKNKDYKNRSKKQDSLTEIGHSLHVTKDEIERKIKNLLSHFSREIKKEKTSSGSGSDSVYKSKWFAFQSMMFLRSKNKPLETVDTEDQVKNVSEDHGSDTSNEAPIGKIQPSQNTTTTNTRRREALSPKKALSPKEALPPKKALSPKEALPPKKALSPKEALPPKKALSPKEALSPKKAPKKAAARKRKVDDELSEECAIVKKTYSERTPKDQYSLFGEQVAIKIRNLPTAHTRSMVQHLINTTLFEGEMGKYDNPPVFHSTSSSSVLDHHSQQPHSYYMSHFQAVPFVSTGHSQPVTPSIPLSSPLPECSTSTSNSQPTTPGIATVSGKEAWSYVNVRPDAHMFWWLYYADVGDQDYSKYPLIVWLQGGPGASSTGYGNFMEIGPQDVSLNPRNTTWTKVANLLFIDNPVGTGFSYVTNESALCTNNTQISQDLLVLMAAFFQKVPEFQSVPLYIFSESYGGKMAVTFSKALYKAAESGKLKCKFHGVALGDSWISPYSSVSTWGEYLYSVSFLDETGLQEISTVVEEIRAAIEKKQFDKATALWGKTQEKVENLTDGVDWYNILRDDGPVNLSTTNKLPKDHPLYYMYQVHVGHLSADALDKLMNGLVKKKLHIIPKNVTWGGQSADVFTALQTDFMKPVIDEVDYLLNRTQLKVVVYSGQLDLIVDTIGTLLWMDDLKWPGMKGFKQANRSPFWLRSKRKAGYVKSFKNLHLYWILKSGHMVPADAGHSALKMLELILGK